MSATALLERLRAAGIELEARSGRLLARPVERLTQAHREQIRAYRAALLELLEATPGTAPFGHQEECHTNKEKQETSNATHVCHLPAPVWSEPLSDTNPPPAAWRLWRLHHPDGTVTEHVFCPPVSLAEVRAHYPDAQLEAIAPPHA